jgi:acetyl-CoA synthetase
VAILAGRIPELLVALLGSLRAGAVPTVLFSSFGPDPVRRRLALARARLLVTTPRLYRDKVEDLRGQLPDLRQVLLVDDPGSLAATAFRGSLPEGTVDLGSWLGRGDASTPDASVSSDDMALLHFTSGTSGEPKGVLHAHEALVAHAHTGHAVLGLRRGLRYWCTADPGWVTGVSYGILAPLAAGSTVFMDEEEFEARRWWENLAREGVEILYTSPTALRLLRAFDAAGVPRRPLPSLQGVFSVGEVLAHAEATWAEAALGTAVRDTWWQTETGSIVVATPLDTTPEAGVIGSAVEGFEVACLERTAGGVEEVASGEVGELAVRAGWPSMFRGYLDRPDLYEESFQDGWYLSGDLATRGADGRIRYVGRLGDVFKSAGHLVSPAEVEDVLLEHDAVADAGVWGRDDAMAGKVIEAHVVLSAGREDGTALRQEILAFARSRLGPALAPRALHIRSQLPRTPSGKILRRSMGPSPSSPREGVS